LNLAPGRGRTRIYAAWRRSYLVKGTGSFNAALIF